MSFQEELYYKIEAYLSGELDAEETAAFEGDISSDDVLKAEVEKHKVANALILEQRLLSVKNILQEEKTKDSNSTNSNKPNNPFGYILLAVAVIGIGTSVWILNKKEDVQASSDEGAAAQIVSGMGKSENNSREEAKMNALKKASKQNVPSEEVGFRKQQIQQIEEHLHTDEKGVLHIDSSFVVKSMDVKSPANTVNTPATIDIPAAAVDPCANISIQGTVKTNASCSHNATGALLVSNIQGGTKPYTVTILDAQKESVLNNALQAGTYQVYITDANACEKVYSNVQIIEKDCPVDYSFNPFIGEKWLIESYKVAGQLEIYNKGGVLYYKENIEGDNSNEWTGIGFNNQTIPGYYIFVIKYVDGTMRKGSVTIVQ